MQGTDAFPRLTVTSWGLRGNHFYTDHTKIGLPPPRPSCCVHTRTASGFVFKIPLATIQHVSANIVPYRFIFIPLITYSMEQIPSWEANWFAASQETPCILWNPKVHYRTHKCQPPVPILSQLDPVHTPTFTFLKIHLNIVLPSTSGSPKWCLSLRFPHQNPVYASPIPHTRYIPAYLLLLLLRQTIIIAYGVPFMVSLITTPLSHRKPSSPRTSHESCRAQGHHKRDTSYHAYCFKYYYQT